jgi:hypothetical protein
MGMNLNGILAKIVADSERSPLSAPQQGPLTLAEHLYLYPQPCPYPLPLPTATVRELYKETHIRQGSWRGREDGYNHLMQAANAYRDAGEALRLALPFATGVAYAYSPRENVGSRGGDHIVCREAIEIDRLKRPKGNTLCQPPSKRFWGLDERSGYPSCLDCLTIAERIVRKGLQR